jgi:putative heme-binding domain-containing protein
LVALGAPDLPARVVDLLQSDPDPSHQLAHAMSIRNHPDDWDETTVDGMMEWTDYASDLHGGHSLRGFVNAAREDLGQSIDPNLLVGHRMTGSIAAIPVDPEAELGRMPEKVRSWKMGDLTPRLSEVGGTRDLERGARVFRGTLCIQCHRFSGDGGSTGPDLTGVSGRYSRADMLRSLIEPSHSISDQYGQTAVTRNDGSRVVGRVVGMTEDAIEVNTNPYGRSVVVIPRSEVTSTAVVETSAMPEQLLDVLEAEEILDLMAYLESGRAATGE